jgi:hypothetical protein
MVAESIPFKHWVMCGGSKPLIFHTDFSIISRHMLGCPRECGGRSSKNTSYFDVPSWPLTSSLELGCGVLLIF